VKGKSIIAFFSLALMADRHANQDWQREQEESRLKAEMERKGLEARLNELQKRFDGLQDERDRLLIESAQRLM
jgi:hypothetical protein